MAEHAILINFRYGLPDLSALLDLEEQLEEVLDPDIGELDGNEVATSLREGSLFLYGRDADVLWRTIEAVVRAASFMRGAEVVLRYGPPEDGVAEKRLTLE